MMDNQNNPLPERIYKIVSSSIWAKTQKGGEVEPMPVDHNDGFMHFSTRDQLAQTLSLHFAGQSGLVILSVATADVSDKLKWEPSRGGALFPHLYGSLSLQSVQSHTRVDVAADGSCALPESIV